MALNSRPSLALPQQLSSLRCLTFLSPTPHFFPPHFVVPQIPRLYNVYKETGVIDNFEQMLRNIFEPLFEVTQDPSSHPQLHVLLGQVSRVGVKGLGFTAEGSRGVLQDPSSHAQMHVLLGQVNPAGVSDEGAPAHTRSCACCWDR